MARASKVLPVPLSPLRSTVASVGATCVPVVKLHTAPVVTPPGPRANKRRLITGCTGDRLSIRLTGTGTVKIHKVEIE